MKADDAVFLTLLKHNGLPVPEREYWFARHIGRKWRFDYAWPAKRVALEVQGGTFIPGGGRHSRGATLRKEHEKLNHAAKWGWRILYCFPEKLAKPSTVALVREALAA